MTTRWTIVIRTDTHRKDEDALDQMMLSKWINRQRRQTSPRLHRRKPVEAMVSPVKRLLLVSQFVKYRDVWTLISHFILTNYFNQRLYSIFLNVLKNSFSFLFHEIAILGKRQRNDDSSHDVTSTSTPANTKFLQRVIEKQNAEIQHLRQEKASMESTINNLTETQEKTLHENKILKKAVTVQQQRQNHALNELEAARQYKEQAENKMKTLEQVIGSLRYHLQAQQPHIGNDFFGLNPPPPDVF